MDPWLGTKGASRAPSDHKPLWHVANEEEIAFANKLLDLHLTGALKDLRGVVESGGAGEGLSN